LLIEIFAFNDREAMSNNLEAAGASRGVETGSLTNASGWRGHGRGLYRCRYSA
jgi:hypothetical protein